MKLYIVLCCFLFCTGCAKSNTNERKTNMENGNNNMKIEFYLYPTENFKDIRYSIVVENGLLIVENHDTLNGTKIPHNISSQKLSTAQIEKLKTLVKETKFVKEESVLVTEGTWGCKLIANNDILFESSYFTYESLTDKQKLITYLLSLLSIKLELYGFS